MSLLKKLTRNNGIEFLTFLVNFLAHIKGLLDQTQHAGTAVSVLILNRC